MARQSTEEKRLAAVRERLRAQVLNAKTHYEVLGVPPGADHELIRGTRMYMASAFHPDRCKLEDAHDLMARVNVAHAVLVDKEQRRKYDAVNQTAKTVCETCRGKGSVLKQKGFKAKVAQPCGVCGGTGCL